MGAHRHEWRDPWGTDGLSPRPRCTGEVADPDAACPAVGSHVSTTCSCGAVRVTCTASGERVIEATE